MIPLPKGRAKGQFLKMYLQNVLLTIVDQMGNRWATKRPFTNVVNGLSGAGNVT